MTQAAAQVEKAPDAPRNPPRVMIVGAAVRDTSDEFADLDDSYKK